MVVPIRVIACVLFFKADLCDSSLGFHLLCGFVSFLSWPFYVEISTSVAIISSNEYTRDCVVALMKRIDSPTHQL